MTKFNSLNFQNFYKTHSDLDSRKLLRIMIKDIFYKKIAVTSSFGAESPVILHLVSKIDKSVPVIFLNTGKLFPKTLEYLKIIRKKLNLTNIKIFKPDQDFLKKYDPNGNLHKTNPNLCCHIRKTLPLKKSMINYDAWINGRKRFHGFERSKLKKIEMVNGLIKINPLADWSFNQIKNYMLNNNLPEHPLITEGYKSIGCQPCTSKSKDSIRDGRWADSLKSECGIHVNEEEDKKYYPSI